MIKRLISCFLMASPIMALGAGGSVELDHIKTDLSDRASLQSGAALYMNYCMACHSLEYGRYNRVAKDLDIPEDIMLETLVPQDIAIGSLMENAMDDSDAKKWFGVVPPDLTLVSRVRGPDWLYTYLRGFYQDNSRPLGVNNAAFANVGMPHVMADLQGLCAAKPEPVHSKRFDPLTGNVIAEGGCEEYATEGLLTASEFDNAIYDLVNFLEYMGEPFALQRERIGWLVIAFLLVFLIIGQLLYRELWKDIH